MKKTTSILIIIILILVSISLIFLISEYLYYNNYNDSWFSRLNSISTAFAAIGGLFLLIVTFLYLLATRKMVQEIIKQNEPNISAKIIPDNANISFIKVILKNTGASPAYNISASFDPDIPYFSTSLNNLKIFQNTPFLDNAEAIEFFFASSYEYFQNQSNPRNTIVTIKYYSSPDNIKSLKIKVLKLQLDERMDQLIVDHKDFNDLVKEVEELKQGLLILLSNIKSNE